VAKGDGPRAGWYRDPTGRHELRRWDGDGWSEWVIDGGRRHFDDIDGCGGPPRGELIPIDGGRGGGGRLRRRRGQSGGAAGARARRGPAARGAGTRPPAPLLVGGKDTNRALTVGLLTTAAASAAGWAVVSLVSVQALRDAVPSVRPVTLRFTLAALAFHAVIAVGLVVAARGRAAMPLKPPTAFGSEDLLRGGIGFLLALFAASFVTQTSRPLGWSTLAIEGDAVLPVEAILLLLVAPVLQERLFRGLLLSGLRDRFGPVVGVLGAAAIAGAALTWMGLEGGYTGVALAAIAAGGVFGWFAHTTEDLHAPMLGHAFLALWTLVDRFS
jgi:membrane protease YdiL (CAAX protease family)